MIVLRVKVQVKPENKTKFVDVMKESIDISSKMKGCVQFGLYEDVVDENAFMLYEEWATRADADAYRNSEHFAESGKVLFPLMAGDPDSAYYQAEKFD